MINGFMQILYNGIVWIYDMVGSYAWAIILFTFALKFLLSPLTYMQRKSMRKMNAINPKLNEIREKYKKDPEKLQQKQMELYKSEGVNPFSGCLPLLIQMPIIFIMFGIVRTLANEQTVAMFLQVRDMVNPADFVPTSLFWIKNIWQPDAFTAPVIQPPEFIKSLQAVQYSRLLTTENLELLKASYTTVMQPVIDKFAAIRNGIGILPVVIAAVSWGQNKLLMPPTQPGADAKKNPMASMNTIMPLMMAFICWSASAGFTLYYMAQTVYSIAEQIVMSVMFKDETYERFMKWIGKGKKDAET